MKLLSTKKNKPELASSVPAWLRVSPPPPHKGLLVGLSLAPTDPQLQPQPLHGLHTGLHLNHSMKSSSVTTHGAGETHIAVAPPAAKCLWDLKRMLSVCLSGCLSVQDVSLSVCLLLSVCMDVWMDGWLVGWMDG